MKAFLYSHYLEQKHFEAFKEMLGVQKVSKALFIIAAAVPYGLAPRPTWLEESLRDIKQFTESVDEMSLEETGNLEDLNQYGFVFVSGGNVFYLAYRLAETGFDKLLKKYVSNGGIYSGSSAGAVVLMDDIKYFAPVDDPTKAPKVYPGLGMVDFAIIPHADNTKYAEGMNAVADKYRAEEKEVVYINDNQVLIINGSNRKVF